MSDALQAARVASEAGTTCSDWGQLFSSTHFCGLPLFVTWAFRLVKPFMRRETYEAMVLKPSFSHLSAHITPENMLPRWGGTFEFDLDDYTDWRAKEEGIDVASLCARGEGRAFDTKAAAAAQAAAFAAAQGEDGAAGSGGGDGGGGGITAPEMIAAGSVARKGVVSKRGSGRGLFSTVRWKRKLLVLNPQALCYFDGTDEADTTNKLGRMMPLDPSATVERVPSAGADSKGPSHHSSSSTWRPRTFCLASTRARTRTSGSARSRRRSALRPSALRPRRPSRASSRAAAAPTATTTTSPWTSRQ